MNFPLAGLQSMAVLSKISGVQRKIARRAGVHSKCFGVLVCTKHVAWSIAIPNKVVHSRAKLTHFHWWEGGGVSFAREWTTLLGMAFALRKLHL